MNVLTALLAFAVAIGILVVAHEFGHYSVARWCGVKVLRFSIGFGRPLLTWTSPRSGTEWTLAWLPLGGYVKMLDERETETPVAQADLPYAFNRQSVAKRMAIVAAGPIANFILAIVLFASIYVAGVNEPQAVLGTPPAGSFAARAGVAGGELVTALRVGDGTGGQAAVHSWTDLHWRLLDAALAHRPVTLLTRRAGQNGALPLDFSALPRSAVSDDGEHDAIERLGFVQGGVHIAVAEVDAGSAAAQAGLQPKDEVLALDGAPVDNIDAFVRRIQGSTGHALVLQIARGDAHLTLSVTPRPAADEESGRTVGRIGAQMAQSVQAMVNVRYEPFEALKMGARQTWDISAFSLETFGRMLTGRASLKNLSGPVTIADYAGRSARMGLSAFVSFLALVSISLGVLNLLPIPVLDGGHLLYYSAEAVTGKAVSERAQGILQRAGIACILALSLIALFNDLTRLIHF